MMGLCCLTFEVGRERWCGAWPAARMMNRLNHSGKRAKCHAGAGRLERRVRPQPRTTNHSATGLAPA